ncbi:MAG: DUF4296 domain-containing protein [Paludibacteraceae bacterium]
MGKHKFIVFAFLLGAVCLSSCRPRGVLSSREMRSVLHDLHRADAILQVAGYNYGHDAALAKYYQQVLEKHGITQAQFDSSLVWYTDHPQRFDKIYPKVVAELEAERTAWEQAHEERELQLQPMTAERSAAEAVQAERRLEELEWRFVHGLRVRYIMGIEQDSIARDSVPLLGPLGLESQSPDSTKQQETQENEIKMQKNAQDSCVFKKKVVPLHAFSGLRPKDN